MFYEELMRRIEADIRTRVRYRLNDEHLDEIRDDVRKLIVVLWANYIITNQERDSLERDALLFLESCVRYYR